MSKEAAKQDAFFEDPKDSDRSAVFVFLAVDGPEPSLCAIKTGDSAGSMKPMVFFEIDTAREFIPVMKNLAKSLGRPIQLQRLDFGRVVCNIAPGTGVDD